MEITNQTIAVTVHECKQVGMDEWRDLKTTKTFSESNTLSDILTWARTIDKQATIQTIKFSDFVK
ncbi:MAG: hypothetical protein V4549_07765 [Bacteroidota bacterium]